MAHHFRKRLLRGRDDPELAILTPDSCFAYGTHVGMWLYKQGVVQAIIGDYTKYVTPRALLPGYWDGYQACARDGGQADPHSLNTSALTSDNPTSASVQKPDSNLHAVLLMVASAGMPVIPSFFFFIFSRASPRI